VLDAGAGSFDAIAGVGDDYFAMAGQARDYRADGIVAAIAGALGFVDGELHEFFFGLVGSGNLGRGYEYGHHAMIVMRLRG